MAYPRHFALSLSIAVLTTACPGEDPTQTPDPTDTTGETDPSTGETLDPDSTSTGEEGWAEICDGSEDLRLAMVLTGGGQVDNEIVREIGFAYLYVRGTCEYWVLPTLDGVLWPDTRTGVLTLESEEALSRALDYGDLADVAGSWDSESLFDASTLLVSDGTHTMACYGGCDQGPEAAQDLWGEQGQIEALWEHSAPYLGPVRVSVVGWSDSTIDELGMPWPMANDPWSLAIDGDNDPEHQAGDSVLIDDPLEAATLRDLRRRYREDDLLEGTPNALQAYGHLTFEEGTDLFQLWIRDALPLEDETGLIPLP